MSDFREVIRQRIMLVGAGLASKPADETADDIISLVVEKCAKIADEWESYKWIPTGPHRDEGHIDFSGSMKDLAAEIRGLAQKR